MCTRYFIDKEIEELNRYYHVARKSPLADRFMRLYSKPVKEEGEIRPMDVVPVIAPDRNGSRAVFPMRWGFLLPGSTKPLVNARVETAGSKPTFKESWVRRRCIIPASWYYEWQHFTSADGRTKTGDRYLIQPDGSGITRLCGLYRMENDVPVFTVLTRPSTEEISFIHDRMPLILPEEYIDPWIDPKNRAEDYIGYALSDMIAEKDGKSGTF